MDRVRDNRVRDRDMGRVTDRVRLRGLAIAAPSYAAMADPNLFSNTPLGAGPPIG